MRADCLQEDGAFSLVFDKLEDDAEIVAKRTCPVSLEFAAQFVGLQAGMERVFGKQAQRGRDGLSVENAFVGKPPRIPLKYTRQK
jgi:hypothetical protein